MVIIYLSSYAISFSRYHNRIATFPKTIQMADIKKADIRMEPTGCVIAFVAGISHSSKLLIYAILLSYRAPVVNISCRFASWIANTCARTSPSLHLARHGIKSRKEWDRKKGYTPCYIAEQMSMMIFLNLLGWYMPYVVKSTFPILLLIDDR